MKLRGRDLPLARSARMLQNTAWSGDAPNAAATARRASCAPVTSPARATPTPCSRRKIGVGWATFVRGQIDLGRPWPPFAGRAGEIAARLVAGLTPLAARRAELARICHWRAGLRWEALELPRIRDRPYEEPAGGGAIYRLPGGALCVHFRTRRVPAGSSPATFTAADSPWSKRSRRAR